MYNFNRGEIYFADLGNNEGSEQSGRRPVLIIQNNVGNKYSPTVIVASITSKIGKNNIPIHVLLNNCGLVRTSMVLMEQIRTLDKNRLKKYIGKVSNDLMNKCDNAIKVSLSL